MDASSFVSNNQRVLWHALTCLWSIFSTLFTIRQQWCCLWRPVHTQSFNIPLSRTTRVSRYQKGKTNLYFTEASDSERQWHQLGHMQVSPDSRHSTPAPHHSVFLHAGCPSWRPTNSIKALWRHNLATSTIVIFVAIDWRFSKIFT